MIYLDVNIPMYLVGADPDWRNEAYAVTMRMAERDESIVTSSEAFQEILHRYRAIDREELLQRAWDQALAIVDDVLPVTYDDVLHARGVQLARTGITARDALHVAVMERHGIKTIASFDAAFDRIPELERLA